MCVGTKIKHISLIGSIFAVLTSIFGVLSLAFGWIGSKAIANDHLDMLRTERQDNTNTHEAIKNELTIIKSTESAQNTKLDDIDKDLTLIKNVLIK